MDAMEAAIGREVVVLEIVSDDDEPGQGPTSDDSVMEVWNEEDDQQRQQLIQQEMREAIAELDGQQIEITELDGQQMVASSQRRTLPDQPTLAERNPWSDKERAAAAETAAATAGATGAAAAATAAPPTGAGVDGAALVAAGAFAVAATAAGTSKLVERESLRRCTSAMEVPSLTGISMCRIIAFTCKEIKFSCVRTAFLCS